MPTTKRLPPNAGKGRPKGALNKTTVEVRELARQLLEDPDYIDALRRRLVRGTAGAIANCRLVERVTDRARP